VPYTGTSAKIVSSPALHQRGVPGGGGRVEPRRCIGHITAVEWSHEHSAAATVATPGGVLASITTLAERDRLNWHTMTSSARRAARARWW